MEAYEKALERERARIDPRTAEPVTIRNLNELKRVLVEFAPHARQNTPHSKVKISTTMVARDERDQQQNYVLSADTQSLSRREMIIEALDLIRTRKEVAQKSSKQDPENIEINNKLMSPVAPFVDENAPMAIDRLIHHWMGGVRKGEFIYWELDNKIYKYDVRQHRLTCLENATD